MDTESNNVCKTDPSITDSPHGRWKQARHWDCTKFGNISTHFTAMEEEIYHWRPRRITMTPQVADERRLSPNERSRASLTRLYILILRMRLTGVRGAWLKSTMWVRKQFIASGNALILSPIWLRRSNIWGRCQKLHYCYFFKFLISLFTPY